MTDLNSFLKTLRVDDVVTQLQAAPDAIGAALARLDETRISRDGAREDLKLAEANAEALAFGMFEESKKTSAPQREALVKKAVNDDASVKVARQLLADFEGEHGRAVADYEKAKAQFAAARSLSDLAAATLVYVSSRNGNGKGSNS